MKNQYTAQIKQEGEWWIGWIEGVPGINCQAAARSELLESLRETLSESLERDDFDLTIHDLDFAEEMAVAERVIEKTARYFGDLLSSCPKGSPPCYA